MQVEIPDTLAPLILSTFQELNPGITQDLPPSVAIRAVIAHWVRETLIKAAIDKAKVAGDTAVARAAQDRDNALEDARDKVMLETLALDEIINPPPAPEPPAEDVPNAT